MTDFYVYQLRIADEDLPFYIGKGKDRRAYEHLKARSDDPNTHKIRKIRKAIKEGKEILVEFLWENLAEKEALRREVWAIHIIGRNDKKEGPLTNRTDGGEGMSGRIISFKERLAMSERMLGYSWSEESRLKKSLSMRGDKHPSFGKKLSEKTKRKISESNSVSSSKYWIIIHPDGREEIVFNMKKFCLDRGLTVQGMYAVSMGKQKHHKGYRCVRYQD